MNALKNRFLFCISFFIFWLFYFIITRIFFLVYYFTKTTDLEFLTILKTFTYGLQLDIAFTGYLSAIPFLIVFISSIFYHKNLFVSIKWYVLFLLICINFMMLVDAGLYQAWGIRLDTSVLAYINTPKLMVASVSKTHIFFGICAVGIFSFLFFKVYKYYVHKITEKIKGKKRAISFVFLLLLASLIIPIRGGFQTIPINQSNVYFSNKMFANHAALNFAWNFFNTLSHKTNSVNPYIYFDKEVAKNIINNRKSFLLNTNTDSILNTKKPNVILIIWEGLPAKIVGSLGGEKEVTPHLNKLSKEGLLFSNFYSNGDRTDKGIPAILSGYYPPPIKRIMRMPNKTRSLAMLPKEMNKLGYTSSFYYGGDLNFGNMNTYLRNAEINTIIDGSVFKDKDWNSKWGAYDDVFMKRFAQDLSNQQKKPFFKIALTLSSHEPYEIKGAYKFGKNNEDNLFRSAHHYTDKVIGNFIDFAKQQEWYKNTLIVIMSDHGHSSPKHEGEYFSPKKFRIPMLWLGGAVNKTNTKINNFSSQVDFAYTLLDLLGGDNTSFTFGKHLFNDSPEQYAHYIFNKGFGTISKNGFVLYDYVSKKYITKKGLNTQALDSLGKAITQDAYQDFLDRK